MSLELLTNLDEPAPAAEPEVIEPVAEDPKPEATPEPTPEPEAPSLNFLEHLDKRLDTLGDEPEAEPEETPVEPEPSAEAPGDDDPAKDFATEDKLPEGWTAEAKTQWGVLRKELAEERTKAKELEQKLSELTSKDPSTELEKQLEEVNSRVAQYEEELAVARVERSEEYQRVVTRPLQALMEASAAIAAKYNQDPEALYDVFSEVDPAKQGTRLAEVVKDMSEPDRIRIYRMADDSASIFAKSAELQQNAGKALKELEAREAKAAEEQSKKHALEVRGAMKDVFGLLEKRMPALEGTTLTSLLEAAQKDVNLTGAPVDQQAYSLAAGVVLPELIKAVRAREAKVAQLEKELASFKKASPKIESSGVEGAAAIKESPKDSVGFMEAINQRI